MAKFLYLFAFAVFAVHAQENAQRNLSPSLRECYENKYLLERDNRLPHTLNTFISILRKIENVEGLNMDTRSLSVAILHRFRQDGIVQNPDVPNQDGITPYAPNSFPFFRHKQTLRLIPGNAISFPNNSITDVERCTLHFMLSSSIEIYQRNDETETCRFTSEYRYPRSVKENKENTGNIANDVETLSSAEIRNMTEHGSKGGHVTVDPNSSYPEWPPNHPHSARYSQRPESKCPVENGVVKTPWGPVSLGLVLAGIAASTQPQAPMLYDFQPAIFNKTDTFVQRMTLNNKWFATLAGDLAEVTLLQGPFTTDGKLSVGLNGNWNSTALPRWYFLNSNKNYQMTTAEIRGDLDGLILADEINKWYSKIPNLRLSQIFDMYYNRLGLFDSSIRACNRRTLFTAVAPNETMVAQTYSAATLLNPDITNVAISSALIEKFSVQAVNALTTYVPTHMNKDLSCADTDKSHDLNPISVDLTIVLDTTWPFSLIKPVLTSLLESVDVNQFNSNFTLINGRDGSAMINSTFDVLQFHAFNSSHYSNVTHGFDMSKSLEELEVRLKSKLDNERTRAVGGARSDVVLIVPYMSDISTNHKDHCLQTIARIREEAPDTTLLIVTYGSKDRWSDLVHDRATDLFVIPGRDTEIALAPISNVVSRIKQVPKRLINSQCGSDYVSSGSLNSFVDYIVPNGFNHYRIHPNYFFNGDHTAVVKIQGSGANTLTVCSSRESLHANSSETAKSCASISSNEHRIAVSCADAAFIHECLPLYISVTSNASTSYDCTDGRVCRFPNLIKYTVSYEDLVCASSAAQLAVNSFILMVALIFYNL